MRESLNPTFKSYPDELAQRGIGVGGIDGMGTGFNAFGSVSTSVATSSTGSFGNCRARFPFRAEAEDELSCAAGDRLELINALDRDWALCRNERGQQGIVPLNVIVKDAR
jgi:hypothetical protein